MKKGTTFGNAGLYRALIWLLKHTPRKVFYVFEAVFVIPFTLVFSSGAHIIYSYFHNIQGWSRWRSIAGTYKNHCIFGQTVIDKFAMYAGDKFRISCHGKEEYDKHLDQQESLILLNAHIGCSEILGYSYPSKKPCNVLVYGGEREDLMSYRKKAFGDRHIKMIPVAAGGSHSEEIIEALNRKEIVSAFADRFFNDKKSVTATLFGREIKLARGPFSLAVTRGLSVFMTSAMKERDGSYTAFFTPLTYDKTLSPREQRQQLADAYCREIERLLKIYPTQWFNFEKVFS